MRRPWLLLVMCAALARVPVPDEASRRAWAEPPPSLAPPPDARARLAAHLDEESRCDLAFLEHLGWRVVEAKAGTGVSVLSGFPGQRASLAAAQAAGDLRIEIAPDAPPERVREIAAGLGPLADTLPSRLAYRHRVADAVREATRKLAENTERGNLTFPQILVVQSPWFRMAPPEPEWLRGRKQCVARESSARAISAFYTRSAVAECYVGQWIALFAAQYELFGHEPFDRAFRPEELVLGRPGDIRETPFGRYLDDRNSSPWRALVIGPSDYGVDAGQALAQMGPVAFAGVSGVVENVEQELFTNDNFVIVSVTPRACEILRTRGGFEYLVKQNEEIWALHAAGREATIPRGGPHVASQEAIEQRLQDPVYTDVILYVHPFGVVPLQEIVRKRIGMTQRPLQVRVYRNGVDDAFFQRYREAFRASCRKDG